MLQFRCTAKVQKALGIKPKELSGIVENDTMLGDWYVNIFMLDRRKTFIFMNEKTLLSFIVYGIKKANIKNIHEMFLKCLNQQLLMEGVDYPVINKLNDEYTALSYTKTNSKKVLGNLNELVHLYTHYVYYEGGLKVCDLSDIIHKINKVPQRNIDWKEAINVAKARLFADKG
jgi:hypothetical protein